MFEQYGDAVAGHVAEVGAGIGTFAARILERSPVSLLLVEPEAACARRLRDRWDGESRVTVAEEALPGSEALRARKGEFDLVVCQNVLEHVYDDWGAVAEMAAGLKPGGQLTVLVPAHPSLFGNLDRAYGHHRRYTQGSLLARLKAAGLEVGDVYAFNLLGVPAWWTRKHRSSPSIEPHLLRAFDTLLYVWRPVEERLRLPWGLSVVAHARKPSGSDPHNVD